MERRRFVLRDFETESGVVLPEAAVSFGTLGRLDARGGNAVLLPSHYMADVDGYDRLIGPGRALDPARLFIVATGMFGNGRSSSPSNTPAPLDGPRFPVTTIRDNVRAAHLLLAAHLGVSRLRAVIGFSMGAQQALQWAVSYPGSADRVVAICGNARTTAHGAVRLAGQIAAIEGDPAFRGGEYAVPPRRGIEATALVWLGWLRSQEWWRRGRWRDGEPPGTTLEAAVARMVAAFFGDADANDLLLQMRSWQRHDVGGPGASEAAFAAALGAIAAPVLMMPCETDLYFPPDEAREEAALMPRGRFLAIPSLSGHPAGAGATPEDARFVDAALAAFLDDPERFSPG